MSRKQRVLAIFLSIALFLFGWFILGSVVGRVWGASTPAQVDAQAYKDINVYAKQTICVGQDCSKAEKFDWKQIQFGTLELFGPKGIEIKRKVVLYDLLVKLKEFIRDNDEEVWAALGTAYSIYQPAPSRARRVEQEIKEAQDKLEKLMRETELRKDIDAILSVMEGK